MAYTGKAAVLGIDLTVLPLIVGPVEGQKPDMSTEVRAFGLLAWRRIYNCLIVSINCFFDWSIYSWKSGRGFRTVFSYFRSACLLACCIML